MSIIQALVRLHKSNKSSQPLTEDEQMRGLQQLADSLCSEEVTILQGVLELRELTVTKAMRALGECNPKGREMSDKSGTYMLSTEDVVDMDLLAELLAVGFSRVPVFQGERGNVVGTLLVKKLIVVDAGSQRKVGSLPLRSPVFVSQACNLQDLLGIFLSNQACS